MQPSEQERKPGGAVVIVALIGETKVLLGMEITKPLPHYWKFVGETVLPGESILSALCRGVAEETGLKLEVRKDGDQVVEITDKRVIAVGQLLPSEDVASAVPHRRHVWGIKVSDGVIESLSGQRLQGDPNETIETGVFDRSTFDLMPNFHPAHRKLMERIKERNTQTQAA